MLGPQEAANATIGSLKRLIEEKNRIIERYERKLSEARLLSRKESAVNKAEIDRLTEKLFRKNEDAISQLKHAVTHLASTELTESGAHLSRRLMEQVHRQTRRSLQSAIGLEVALCLRFRSTALASRLIVGVFCACVSGGGRDAHHRRQG
jgi:predicted RNase H-like nuclease (RuvC/YqgF family)